MWREEPAKAWSPPPPRPQRDYTLRELRRYDGKHHTAGGSGSGGCGVPPSQLRAHARSHAHIRRPTILVALDGVVYDVTERGAEFYGEGAPYEVFAGRDATRAKTVLCPP